MAQNNNGYQDLIINNGVISTVSNMVSSDNSTLQGIQMTNQFAICANTGSTPVLVPYISPMILSPQTTKMSMDGNNQDQRSHNGNGYHQISINNQQTSGHIQLANNITIPSSMINSGHLPLGLSYINLSSLTSQTGGIPIQFAFNTGTNQQFTLPLSSITQLTNDLQISNAYTFAPQIKFEAEVNTNEQVSQISVQPFQKTVLKRENETPVQEIPPSKRGRKKVIVRRSSQITKRQKVEEVLSEPKSNAPNGDNEIMYDQKGRPFMYPCNQCPKKFTQNSRLTAHLRCHSGIRPYTCTQCGFSFTQKSYLIRHAAVHKEDRPFTCAKCMKTYKHYGSLANHRKLHCKEMLNEANAKAAQHRDCGPPDDLDETIQQTIESVQMNHHQNNYILAYTSNSSEMQSTPIVYFNHNSNGVGAPAQTATQLSGSGPVVFPSHSELPSMSAVSLLPQNRSAINELKAITTHQATDVDEMPTSTAGLVATKTNPVVSSMHFQQHIKQEPAYFSIPLRPSLGTDAET